jgi:hypothetical protein
MKHAAIPPSKHAVYAMKEILKKRKKIFIRELKSADRLAWLTCGSSIHYLSNLSKCDSRTKASDHT